MIRSDYFTAIDFQRLFLLVERDKVTRSAGENTEVEVDEIEEKDEIAEEFLNKNSPKK